MGRDGRHRAAGWSRGRPGSIPSSAGFRGARLSHVVCRHRGQHRGPRTKARHDRALVASSTKARPWLAATPTAGRGPPTTRDLHHDHHGRQQQEQTARRTAAPLPLGLGHRLKPSPRIRRRCTICTILLAWRRFVLGQRLGSEGAFAVLCSAGFRPLSEQNGLGAALSILSSGQPEQDRSRAGGDAPPSREASRANFISGVAVDAARCG